MDGWMEKKKGIEANGQKEAERMTDTQIDRLYRKISMSNWKN